MKTISTAIKVIKQPRMILNYCVDKGMFDHVSDKLFLRIAYYAKMGKFLNIKKSKELHREAPVVKAL